LDLGNAGMILFTFPGASQKKEKRAALMNTLF